MSKDKGFDPKEYWKNRPKESAKNCIDTYIDAPISRSETIRDILRLIPTRDGNIKDKKILEIGCNVGRNLNYLAEDGFTNLYGIDINPEAIKQSRVIYDTNFHTDTLEASEIRDNYDIIFTMAVLEHLDAKEFGKLKDKLKHLCKVLITIEDEITNSARHFSRNYKDEFEDAGFKQIATSGTDSFPKDAGLNYRFIARVFANENS